MIGLTAGIGRFGQCMAIPDFELMDRSRGLEERRDLSLMVVDAITRLGRAYLGSVMLVYYHYCFRHVGRRLSGCLWIRMCLG